MKRMIPGPVQSLRRVHCSSHRAAATSAAISQVCGGGVPLYREWRSSAGWGSAATRRARITRLRNAYGVFPAKGPWRRHIDGLIKPLKSGPGTKTGELSKSSRFHCSSF